jgi:hypothetical protein
MTKAKAKLSWALTREMQVRVALGGRGSNWTKGRRGARMAAGLLAARKVSDAEARVGPSSSRMPNGRRRVGWHDVPQHVQALVLAHVSLADVEVLRLAGFGGTDAAWRSQLARTFARRRSELREVLRMFVMTNALPPRGPSGLRGWVSSPRDVSDRFRPVMFSRTDRLVLHVGKSEQRDFLDAVASGSTEGSINPGALPLGIGEMHNLRSLELLPCAGMTSLPSSLARCTDLRVLIMAGHDFTALPQVVLKLRYLRVLSLAQNRRLKSLPDQLGDALQCLGELDIRGCVGLRILPVSALKRLDESGRVAASRGTSPLLLSLEAFPRGYLEKAFGDAKCPLLRAFLVCELLGGEE